jgi:hypothetical protein
VRVFYERYEKALRRSSTGESLDGRLQGMVRFEIADLHGGERRPVEAPFELFGPGDVRGLARGAITRRFPSPGASDAERTKLALVEFAAPDLPWRYTPVAAADDSGLPPWLVLVVGPRTPDGIVERPDGTVTLGPGVQQEHDLRRSHRWAHVHQTESGPIARLLCPKRLGAEEAGGTEYLACLVPAFDAHGGPAWPARTSRVTLACYDRWSFRTGPAGDFPALASRLRKADLTALEAAGTALGRVGLRHPFAPPGEAPAVIGGVLRLARRPDDGPDPLDDPPPDEVGDQVEAMVAVTTDPPGDPAGRTVIGPPRYDRPFRDTSDRADEHDAGLPQRGWVRQLRRDPRARAAAGLGAWAAIAWQEAIADAAATKAGDLRVAQQRLRQVALGVEASRSLWRRHLPDDPVGQLAVLAPMLGRLPARTSEGTMTALRAVTGRTPDLAGALLSSAARRALRPGTARTVRAAPGASELGRVLETASRCPGEEEDPADVINSNEHEVDPGRVEEAIHLAVVAAAGDRDDLATLVLERWPWHELEDGRPPWEARLAAILGAFTAGPDGEADDDLVHQLLDEWEAEIRDHPASLWTDWVHRAAPEEACREGVVRGLAQVVVAAVDPTVTRPPAVRRVLATLPGVHDTRPLELEPELDLPLWSFLSKHAPTWLLPGGDALGEHQVVGLATDPAFVTALLAGANHQAVAELRWRNQPLVSGWSPLRRFWQRPDGSHDIVPIRGWPDDVPLGAPPLLASGPDGEAVVAFKTPLFRRYPTTVVYLYPADEAWTPPDAVQGLTPSACRYPTFTGTIGEDLVFFGFAVEPSSLARYWVVLEEPPSGYRFYHELDLPPSGPGTAPPPGADDATGRGFAARRFALPVRVLIGPLR